MYIATSKLSSLFGCPSVFDIGRRLLVKFIAQAGFSLIFLDDALLFRNILQKRLNVD